MALEAVALTPAPTSPAQRAFALSGRGLHGARVALPCAHTLHGTRVVRLRALTALLACVTLGGCDAPSVEGLPERLADLRVPRAARHVYAPRHPLWTNGADKVRAVVAPDGTRPDVDAVPPGTLFFKEITAGGVLVETRVIRITADGPEYAAYVHVGGDPERAFRTTDVASREVAVEVDGEAFVHVVPSDTQCAMCHEAGAGPILGFTALQLDTPLATLGVSEVDEAVVGYALGNCAHCHNGSGAPGASFDLRPAVFVAHTVDVPTAGSASAAGLRVVPGAPERSVLYRALVADHGVAPMPPLGVQRRDEAFAEVLAAWITALSPNEEETP